MYDVYIRKKLKLKRKSGNISIKCPFHYDTKPSASINFDKRLFNCYKGDACVGGLNFQQLYELLREEEEVENGDNKPTKIPPKNNRKTRNKEEKIRKRDVDTGKGEDETPRSTLYLKAETYFRERGLNPDNFPIEWDVQDNEEDEELKDWYGYILFQSLDEYFTGRNLLDNGKPKYFNQPTEKDLYWVKRDHTNKVVFLTEGIFDCLSLHELDIGIENICCSNGAGFPKKSADTLAYKLKGNTVLVIYDNDAAGFKGAKSVAAKLKEFEVDHAVLELPRNLGSDLNDALINDRDRLYKWMSTILDRYAPDDKVYTKNLFTGKEIEPLNILPTGIAEIDRKLTGGFKDGGHFISGETGIGKTSFVFNLAKNAAEKHNKRIMINSCEISKRQSWARVATQFSKYTWEQLEEDPQLLEPDAYKKVKSLSDRIIVVNGWPLNRIIQEAPNYDVIIIDYIQRVREVYQGDESASRHLINNYVSRLTDLGALQGKICIIISSLSRSAYGDPNSYGLKESGSLEFMATSVSRLSAIGVSGEKFQWNIQKNTRGETGVVRVEGVDLGHCKFGDE